MRRFLLTYPLIPLFAWCQSDQPQASSSRDFLSGLQALGPLIAAAVAVGVASMQYYLQRQQMKQQLFDKRFTIYRIVKIYLSAVLTDDAEYQRKQFRRFGVAQSQAEFLFGPEVLRFIDDFQNLIRQKHYGEREEGEANLELINRAAEGIDGIFRPYLQLHNDKPWLARLIDRINRWVDRDLPAAMASRYHS